jgi:hypothetical protein
MENGIKVDVSALSNTYPALESELNKLLGFAQGLNRNLSIAAVKFNSENFKRASNILSVTQRNLSKTQAELYKLKGFFDKLQSASEEYLSIRF